MKKSLSTMMKQLLTMCDVTLHSVYGGVFFVLLLLFVRISLDRFAKRKRMHILIEITENAMEEFECFSSFSAMVHISIIHNASNDK